MNSLFLKMLLRFYTQVENLEVEVRILALSCRQATESWAATHIVSHTLLP